MSETYFGGYDMSKFDFVGFYETRSDDLWRLSSEIDVPLSDQVLENATPIDAQEDRDAFTADAKAMGQLRDLLANDVAFYEAQFSRR